MNWTMSVVNAAEAEAPPRRGPSSVVGADGEPVGELGADADIRGEWVVRRMGGTCEEGILLVG